MASPVPRYPFSGKADVAKEIAYRKDLLQLADYVVSGFAGTPAGLVISFSAGIGFIGGLKVGDGSTTPDNVTLTDNETNRIYLKRDGTLEKRTSGTPGDPANSTKIYTYVTSGGSITQTTDHRDLRPVLTSGLRIAGTMEAGDGNVAGPGYAFKSDPDTGIFSAGANAIAIATAGVERLRVDATGKVGIGLTAPDVGGSGGDRILSLGGSTSTAVLEVSTTAADAAGVGVGWLVGAFPANAANHKLIARIAFETEGATATQRGGIIRFLVKGNGTTAINEAMRIDSAGKVGVNVTPIAATMLSVAIDTTVNDALTLRGAGPGGVAVKAQRAQGSLGSPTIVAADNTLLDLSGMGYDGATYLSAGTIRVEVDGTPGLNDMPGRILFLTTADGAASPTERMRITSAGHIGIGTAAPNANSWSNANVVTVHGTSALKRAFIELVNPGTAAETTTDLGSIHLLGKNGGASPVVRVSLSATLDGATDAAYLAFTTSTGGTPTERMRIKGNGKVLIGSDAPSITTPLARLHVTLDGEGVAFAQYSGDASPGTLGMQKARGSEASPAVVQNNDDIGEIVFEGYDGSAFRAAAKILVEVNGTPGGTDMPGRIVFLTSPDNSATPVERLRIGNGGVGSMVVDSGGQVFLAVQGASSFAGHIANFRSASARASIRVQAENNSYDAQVTLGGHHAGTNTHYWWEVVKPGGGDTTALVLRNRVEDPEGTTTQGPTEHFHLTWGGLLGIGLAGAVPTSPIHAAGDQSGGNSPIAILRGTQIIGAGGRTVRLDFEGITNDTGPVYSTFGYLGFAKVNATQGNANAYFVLATNGGAGPNERVRVTEEGNIRVNVPGTPGAGLAGKYLHFHNGSAEAAIIVETGSGSSVARLALAENGAYKYLVSYNAAANYFVIESADGDGGGTDAEIIRIPDGQLTVDFNSTADDNAFDYVCVGCGWSAGVWGETIGCPKCGGLVQWHDDLAFATQVVTRGAGLFSTKEQRAAMAKLGLVTLDGDQTFIRAQKMWAFQFSALSQAHRRIADLEREVAKLKAVARGA